MRPSPTPVFPAPNRAPALSLLLSVLLAILASPLAAQTPPTFPGAEGFGAKATGGRGGAVLKVTTLAASGPGSLQWALDQPDPRIIVFAVSGVIEGDVEIPHGDVTIAGQSAPGAGITIHGHLYTRFGSAFGNIVLRHFRVRPPDPDAEWPAAQHDAIQLSTNHTLMLDHVDASHGADEILDLWGGATDVTIQWSALTYPIYDPVNGWTHNKGLLAHRPCEDSGTCDAGDPPGGRVSVHHNLFVHARNRTPALSIGPAEVINNLTFNGREGFVHHNIARGDFNIVGNVYVEGPSISLAPFFFDPENGTPSIPTRYWTWDNRVEDPGKFVGRVDDPFTTPGFDAAYSFHCCGIVAGQFNAQGPFDFASPGHVPVTVHDSTQVEATVLSQAGAFPRDVVNGWAVADVTGRSGAWGNRRPADWLEGLPTATPPEDLDDDGMADTWELDHGLDPTDGTDHGTLFASGYTAIEVYLNELADDLVAAPIFDDDFEDGGLALWARTRGAVAASGAASFDGSFGLAVPLGGGCSGSAVVELSGGPQAGPATVSACEEIHAENLTVAGSGPVTFTAGRLVALGDGFAVAAGGRFTAGVDPSLDPGRFVEDTSPSSERRYNARFQLRLDAADLATGRFVHWQAQDASGTPWLRLVLLRNTLIQPAEDRLILEARLDDGSWVSTEGVAEVAVPAGWHTVELAWRGATGSQSNGAVELWLDDQPAADLSGLDDHQARIDTVRWGAPSGLGSAPSGTLHGDDFVSRQRGRVVVP